MTASAFIASSVQKSISRGCWKSRACRFPRYISSMCCLKRLCRNIQRCVHYVEDSFSSLFSPSTCAIPASTPANVKQQRLSAGLFGCVQQREPCWAAAIATRRTVFGALILMGPQTLSEIKSDLKSALVKTGKNPISWLEERIAKLKKQRRPDPRRGPHSAPSFRKVPASLAGSGLGVLDHLTLKPFSP